MLVDHISEVNEDFVFVNQHLQLVLGQDHHGILFNAHDLPLGVQDLAGPHLQHDVLDFVAAQIRGTQIVHQQIVDLLLNGQVFLRCRFLLEDLLRDQLFFGDQLLLRNRFTLNRRTFPFDGFILTLSRFALALGGFILALGGFALVLDGFALALGGFTLAFGRFTLALGRFTLTFGGFVLTFGRFTLTFGGFTLVFGRGLFLNGRILLRGFRCHKFFRGDRLHVVIVIMLSRFSRERLNRQQRNHHDQRQQNRYHSLLTVCQHTIASFNPCFAFIAGYFIAILV